MSLSPEKMYNININRKKHNVYNEGKQMSALAFQAVQIYSYLAPSGEEVADIGEHPVHHMPHRTSLSPVHHGGVGHTLLVGGHIHLGCLAEIYVQ